MSRPTTKPRTPPATRSAMLLTVSLAICFGAAAEARVMTASPMPRAVEVGERVALNARQRHALATLFAHLTDAARQFQQGGQVAVAPISPRVTPMPVTESAALRRPLDRPQSLPTPPLRAALLNLPPPTH